MKRTNSPPREVPRPPISGTRGDARARRLRRAFPSFTVFTAGLLADPEPVDHGYRLDPVSHYLVDLLRGDLEALADEIRDLRAFADSDPELDGFVYAHFGFHPTMIGSHANVAEWLGDVDQQIDDDLPTAFQTDTERQLHSAD